MIADQQVLAASRGPQLHWLTRGLKAARTSQETGQPPPLGETQSNNNLTQQKQDHAKAAGFL